MEYKRKGLKLKAIEKAACKVLKLDPLLFHVDSQRGDIVMAKHYFSYIARELTTFKLREIGTYIGRNHSSVSHSVKTILNLEYDKRVLANLAAIRKLI